MKIFISEIDRQNARSVALKNIARYFSIPDWEIKSNELLQQEVEKLVKPEAKSIVLLLKEYFTAYDEWFNFYQKIKAIETEQDIDYELNNTEQLELQKLIDNRESTLGKLQSEFDKIQLRKFNQGKFGTDITGTTYQHKSTNVT